jgi:hypothetical protein
MDKDSKLLQWGVDQAIDNLLCEGRILGANADGINIYQILESDLEESRYAWKKTREETADIGSTLHQLIETYINIKLSENDRPVAPFFKMEVKKHTEQIQDMFQKFLEWEKENVKCFLESEQSVCDINLCIAGTLDIIFLDKDDKIICADLKTSDNIYREHEMQVIAYKYIRNRMQGQYQIKKTSSNVIHNYGKIQIDKPAILQITRQAELKYVDNIKDESKKLKCFLALLTVYYTYAKRRLNNKRAIGRY